jgi:hypothetical protein
MLRSKFRQCCQSVWLISHTCKRDCLQLSAFRIPVTHQAFFIVAEDGLVKMPGSLILSGKCIHFISIFPSMDCAKTMSAEIENSEKD